MRIKIKTKKLDNFNHINDIQEARRIMNNLYSRWKIAAKANWFFILVLTVVLGAQWGYYKHMSEITRENRIYAHYFNSFTDAIERQTNQQNEVTE